MVAVDDVACCKSCMSGAKAAKVLSGDIPAKGFDNVGGFGASISGNSKVAMQFDNVLKFCCTKMLRAFETFIIFVLFEIGSKVICSIKVLFSGFGLYNCCLI